MKKHIVNQRNLEKSNEKNGVCVLSLPVFFTRKVLRSTE
jgi:hypothetical protein